MAGVPLDGDVPQVDPNASYPMPPDEGKVKGGFWRTLLGRKATEEADQKTRHAEWVMNTLHEISTGTSVAPDSIVKLLVREAGSTFGPEFGQRIKQHFDEQATAKRYQQKQAALQQTQPQPLGVPAVPAPAPAPAAEPLGFSPVGGPPAAPPQPPPDAGTILQRLVPMLAQQQQGAPPPGGPPGMQPPPFVNGAGAGPAPEKPNPVAAMKVGSIASATGFGGPPAVTPPTPGQSAFAVPPSEGNIFRMGPVQRGVDAAAVALPTALQAGQIAVGQAGAIHAQTIQQERAEQERKMAEIEKQDAYKNLPDLQKEEVRMRVMGIQGQISPLQRPLSVPGLVPGNRAPSGQLDFSGQPLDPNQLYSRRQNLNDGSMEYFPTMGTSSRDPEQDPNSSTGYSKVWRDRAGNELHRELNAIPPNALIPRITTNTGTHIVMVTQPDGSTKPVPVEGTGQTTRVGVLPGAGQRPAAVPPLTAPPAAAGQPATPRAATPRPAAAPAAAAPIRGARAGTPGEAVGGRPLTPEQMVKNSQQAEQLNNTIGTIKDIKDKIPMLASMIQSGKIQMQVDPHQGFWRGLINKNMPLTEEEKQLASDWQLLTEGVMQMRLPMGGGGFSGPEGFGAIQSNKGILSQNPDIIRKVLEGTLREFKAQRQPLVDAGKKYGYKVNPEYEAGFTHGGTPPPMSTPPGAKPMSAYEH